MLLRHEYCFQSFTLLHGGIIRWWPAFLTKILLTIMVHMCCFYITIYINGTLINSTAGTGICSHNRVMPYLFIHFIPFPLWCPWIIPQPADFLINGSDIQVGQTYRTAAQGNTSWGLDSLQWRHNGRDGVSNHQPRHCLLNRLFRRRSKKTSKVRVTGLCAGNSPVTGEFPAQRASDAENVSIWWRHHVWRKIHMSFLSSSNMASDSQSEASSKLFDNPGPAPRTETSNNEDLLGY